MVFPYELMNHPFSGTPPIFGNIHICLDLSFSQFSGDWIDFFDGSLIGTVCFEVLWSRCTKLPETNSDFNWNCSLSLFRPIYFPSIVWGNKPSLKLTANAPEKMAASQKERRFRLRLPNIDLSAGVNGVNGFREGIFSIMAGQPTPP